MHCIFVRSLLSFVRLEICISCLSSDLLLVGLFDMRRLSVVAPERMSCMIQSGGFTLKQMAIAS